MRVVIFRTEFGVQLASAAEAEQMFVSDADRKFQNDAVDFLLEKTSFDLPEAFLKRWMQTVSEKPVTIDEIEQDFEGYKKSLKWLKHLGFTVEPPEPYGPKGAMFCPFWRAA